MATVRVSRDIEAPVDSVFALFTDIEHGSQNVSGIKKVKMVTFGPLRLGSRWIETREVIGRPDDAEMEITAFEHNRGYTITHHKAGVRIDTSFSFEPFENGTRVSVEFGLRPQGLPPALLSPLEWAMSGKVRDVLSQDLLDLKQSVEKVCEVDPLGNRA
ncbi:MAG: SRPBCC family protein [Vicinamibacterales bacterium]